ncbi:hypothetical protein C2S52_001782 [Perilla frutescens var. hirtella]|nr:hypothetical protein C2S51_006782 [Perilla frutescens var. frutescens]KAH6801318.1 hypothetical protein C2S52_001782 [Perilla frutescens var. hirtella]
MKRSETSSKKKVERKTIEKNRRILMKLLSFKMVSLIPGAYLPQPKEFLSQQDQIGYSAAYIEILRERVDELRKRKTQLTNNKNNNNDNVVESKVQPILTVMESGFGVEVVLISGLIRNFSLHDVTTIIEEAAAEVLTVSVYTIDAKIIHTIHAKAKISRVGVDTAKINERIQELISST